MASKTTQTSGSCSGPPGRKPLGREPQGDRVCDVCGKAYARADNLRRHIKQDHGDRETFHCLYCDSTATRKDNLAKHIRTHHNEMTCKVTGCAWKGLSDNYIQHVVDNHRETFGSILFEAVKKTDEENEASSGEGEERDSYQSR